MGEIWWTALFEPSSRMGKIPGNTRVLTANNDNGISMHASGLSDKVPMAFTYSTPWPQKNV